ncbi:MAG: hypothetical protein ACKVQW_09820 [Pyrinomonadaceae bacterium]
MLLILATAAMIAPIWSVERFVVQDGSAHLNTSFMMSEMLKGNDFFRALFEFNSPFVPNSSAHWLIAVLLQFFAPFVVTKIMMTLAFVLVPLSVLWLRRQVVGPESQTTAFLIGSACSFNWFWMLGTFNFMFGLAGFAFTLGLFWRWRNEMNAVRSFVIFLLVTFIFFTHLVGFLLITGSILVLAISARNESRKSALLWTAPAMFAASVLFLLFKTQIGDSGGGLSPFWSSMSDPYALRSWFDHLVSIDPFVLLSRKTMPLTDFDSPYFALFSPALWILAAVTLLLVATLLTSDGRRGLFSEKLPFVLLAAGATLVVLFGPEYSFNVAGGLLRQRLAIAAVIFFVPLFAFSAGKFKLLAQGSLMFVLIFQTAVMWEYAFSSNEETRGFVEAGREIPDGQKIASTVILRDRLRFHSFPVPQMINYIGTGRNLVIVDNYAMGYNLFSILMSDAGNREFNQRLTASNVLYAQNPLEDFGTDLRNLDFCLSNGSGKIDTMLLYGRDDAVEAILRKTFEPQPFYESGNIRLFRKLGGL